jgi:hypothetical protein
MFDAPKTKVGGMKMSDQHMSVIEAEAIDITPPKIEDFTSKTPEEIAMINAKSERKRIVAALETGALCCLPGENGYADTTPAKNLINRSLYHGVYQLLLKDHQKQNGFPTAEFGTFAQFEKASRFAGKDGIIKKGERGTTITLNVNGELKSIRLFNIAQAVHPEAIRAYADHVYQEKQEYLKQAKGADYREPKPRTEGAPIACSSVKPEEYLGQYFAALSLDRGFKATPRQAAQFAENMKNTVFEKSQTGHINPYNLNMVCNRASAYCKSPLYNVKYIGILRYKLPEPLAARRRGR